MKPAAAEVLRDALVPWFAAHARVLPWRSDPSPYHVLLSELMLQQTRVETVLPFYARFLARWPRLEDLAAAEEEEVLHAWAGLGYYRRARSLLAAAQGAVAQGGLTGDVDALRALPGIGPYTAGAIASIAFGVPAAAVDGNVERVICRVDGRQDDPKKGPGRRALAERVGGITAPGVASAVTQGLMELGATVCTPRQPRCGACPWGAVCVARATDQVDQLPRLAPRRKPVPVQGVAGILAREGAVLLGKRPEGLLGGMWEPICDEVAGALDPAAVTEVFARRTGLSVQVTAQLGEVVHVFTHRRLTLAVYLVAPTSGGQLRGDGSYDGLAFADPGASDLPLSTLARKVLALRRAPGLPLG